MMNFFSQIVDYAWRDESEGMRTERQFRRTRPKVIASCWAREWKPEAVGRGFLPREEVIERGNDGARP